MRGAGLTPEVVVQTAAELADAGGLGGFDALTLAAVAARLGVRSPSLYAHVGGLSDLRGRLSAHGAVALGAALSQAAVGRSGSAALRSMADAYRAFAHAHPGLYAALQQPGPAGAHAVEIVLAVVRGYGWVGEDAIHAVRSVRSALHGFVALELGNGFGMDASVETSWARLIGLIDRGLALPSAS